MSEIHERIGDEVMRVLEDGVTGNEVATAILAAVRDELLSDEVVEWGAEVQCDSMGIRWDILGDDFREKAKSDIRRTMVSMLGAAGIGEEAGR